MAPPTNERWERQFEEPIPVPGQRPIRTLRDAAAYIEALSPAEQQHERVQAALYVLLQAADHGGPMLLARMGVSAMIGRFEPPPRLDRAKGEGGEKWHQTLKESYETVVEHHEEIQGSNIRVTMRRLKEPRR
ncbi:hypothetical protein KQX64_07190 [Rhodopseudomonas palustris]|nr:hypothetical protein KQX64_07190 [Rhodopseudomonas palustris]